MPDDAALTFRTLLRRFRHEAGLTQEELAEHAGVSIRAISDLERGLRKAPHSDTVKRLADALALASEDRDALFALVPRHRQASDSPSSEYWPAYLPAEVTPLVGREREEASTVHLLRSPSVRLVTLIGPGGVGKTRLALRAATTLAEEYRDGVVFVPLATVSAESQVAGAIAGALGVRDDRSQTAEEIVIAQLRERELLLVLDNFEHLAGAAVLVSTLLLRCPHITVLATSRAPLSLRGEQLLDVPPLRVPAAGEQVSAAVASNYSAIALFIQRAQARKADFSFDDERVAIVAAICRRLDGLPLAIELAAAQIRQFSLHEVLERLQQGTADLWLGPIDLPPRQQTMRATIAWSYALLNALEKLQFQRLSVFVGGWTPAAAQAIVNSAGSETLPLMQSLADKSLVLRHGDDGEQRFSMLETIREYSIERASRHEEIESWRRRHAEYFLQLSEQAGETRRDPSLWSARVLADQENLDAALRWLTDSGRIQDALTFAGNLSEYWITWGNIREGRARLDHLLDLAEVEEVVSPPVALVGAARLAQIQCDWDRSWAFFEQAATAFQENGDQLNQAASLVNLGTVAHLQTQYDRATEFYQRGLALARHIDDSYGAAVPLSNLGLIAMQQGKYRQAAALLDEALSLWRELGNEQKLGVTLANRASLAFRLGELDDAVRLQEEALSWKKALGDRLAIAHSLGDLGWVEIERGNHEQAHGLLHEAFTTFREMGRKDSVAESLEAMGRIAQQRGQLHRSAHLYSGAAALRQQTGSAHHPADLPRYESALHDVRSAMPSQEFDAAWELGKSMSLDRLAEEAEVYS